MTGRSCRSLSCRHVAAWACMTAGGRSRHRWPIIEQLRGHLLARTWNLILTFQNDDGEAKRGGRFAWKNPTQCDPEVTRTSSVDPQDLAVQTCAYPSRSDRQIQVACFVVHRPPHRLVELGNPSTVAGSSW